MDSICSPPSSPFLTSPVPDRSSSPFLLVPIPERPSFVSPSPDRSSSLFLLEPIGSPTLPPTPVVIRRQVVPWPTLIPPPPSGPLRQRPLCPISRLPVPVTRQTQPTRIVTPAQPALVSQSLIDRRRARQQRERPWASAPRSTRVKLTSALTRPNASPSAVVRAASQEPLQGADNSRSEGSTQAPRKKVSFAEVRTVKVVSRWISDVPADYSEWRHN